MRKSVLTLLGLLAFGTWSQPAQAQVPEPLAEIVADFEATFNQQDGAGIAAIYTEDAVRFPPEEEAQHGRKAIAADVANYAGLSIDLEVVGGLLEGDVATSWGTYKLTGTDEDGEPIVISGRWMNALKKTAAGWKIHRDIWHLGTGGN